MCILQMMKRVYKGIPLKLRGQAWALLLDVEKVKEANYRKYEVGALQESCLWDVFGLR